MLRRLLFVFCVMICGAGARERYDAAPVRLLTAIYRTYTATTLQPGLPDVYSRRLQGLIDTDLKNTPEGDAGTIDWDVFVDGNNWAISNLKITLVRAPKGARPWRRRSTISTSRAECCSISSDGTPG